MKASVIGSELESRSVSGTSGPKLTVGRAGTGTAGSSAHSAFTLAIVACGSTSPAIT